MLTNSSSIPTLIAQLQARYPSASLIAEFVTIHQDRFVVRALVQIGGITLATSMAAAADIEQAEDRAKVRVLTALGIGSLTPVIPSQPVSYPFTAPPVFAPSPDLTISDSLANSDAEDLASSLSTNLAPAPSSELPQSPEVSTTSPVPMPFVAAQSPSFTTSTSFAAPLPQIESDQTESNRTAYELNYEPGSYEFENHAPQSYTFENYGSEDAPAIEPPPTVAPITEASSQSLETAAPPSAEPYPDTAPTISSEPTKPASSTGKGKSAKRKSENTDPPPPTDGESDRSEEIAKIGLEMKRLGWTTEQGRNYLKRTYGKRSRQELDDSELIDFLRYLETQVSPSESPF